MAKYVDSTGLSHLMGLIKGKLLPPGGSAGQVLAKSSGTDYDVAWVTAQGGVTVDSAFDINSTNPVQNRSLVIALGDKMPISPSYVTMAEGAYFDNAAGELYIAPSEDADPYLAMYADGTIAWDNGSGVETPLSLEGHEHDAGDLTSGTLADARLPTKGSAGTAGTSSATSGATLAVPYLTTDAYGRVTAKGTHTHTISGLAPTAITHIYYQAKGSGNKSLAAGTITQVTLAATGALSSGSGLAIASGGIKVTNAGRYRVTGSAYIAAGGTNHGCYVYKAASSGAFSAASEIFSGLTTNTAAGGVLAGTKIVQCAANDIIYLAARSTGAASTCDQDSASTYLLVERLS